MAAPGAGQGPLDRIAAFRFIYLGIFVFVVLSVSAQEAAESLLGSHFRRVVEEAVRVSPADGPIVPQIQNRMTDALHSRWITIGGIRVNPLVLGADSRTPIFLGGRTIPPPRSDPGSAFREAAQLLPAITAVDVTLPLDSLLAGSIWVGFGLILFPVLFRHQRAIVRREQVLISAAVTARNAAASRAKGIQEELEHVSQRLSQLEPTEHAQAQEIAKLERERGALRNRMVDLARREHELRDQAAHANELEEERRTLEEMLEEALGDLDSKQGEIQELNDRLKRASKGAGKAPRRGDALARRMKTLYRNLEIDDRAIQDMLALGDETQRLRAEESLKRLDDDPESAGVRRKVGGLPAGQSIFELGFAGKGRIYYARGRQRPFRVLAVGGKASQKQDLDYLRRLPLD